MRRSPLKRTARLKRRTRVTPRRATPRRSSRVRDRAYLLWVKSLPCAASGLDPNCEGVVEAAHMGARGLGQKCSDREAGPLCVRHHRAPGVAVLHPWIDWSKAERTEWFQQVIENTLAIWGAGLGSEPW